MKWAEEEDRFRKRTLGYPGFAPTIWTGALLYQRYRSDCTEVLEGGVLEFPTAFTDFIALMKELDVKLEPVNISSGMFF